jgi:putative DNA primase/helicase
MTELPFLAHAHPLALARAGFAVFPCKPRGKEPMVAGGFKAATCDEAQIRDWWTRSPEANIAIATGALSGVLVVDIDGEDGARLLLDLAGRYGALPVTLQVKTCKGAHFYFALPDGCGRVPSSKGDGLDIRADGGYAIAPPSIHPSGARYEWVEGVDECALAPDWLIDFARNRKAVLKAAGRAAKPGALSPRPNGQQRPAGSTVPANGHGVSLGQKLANTSSTTPWSEGEEARLRSALAVIPADDRDIWLKVGFALRDLAQGDSRWAAPGRGLWDDWSRTCPEKFSPPDEEKAWASFDRDYHGPRITVATIYHLAHEAGWSDPSQPLNLASDKAPTIQPRLGVDFSRRLRTDANNALIFVDLFVENLRFVEAWRCWLVWDGTRWREVSDLALLPMARQATEEILKWAVALLAVADREAWIKHAVATQRDARLRAMIGLAKGEARLRIEPDALDADAWLLGCPNGTLDLRTGKLREARREDFITNRSVFLSTPEPIARNGVASSVGRHRATASWSPSFKHTRVTR